jgi:single-strand DNA-binding protein
MSLNTVILSGRAGRDPEVRYFESGQHIAKFTMAVDRNAKGEDADWFDVEVWGKSAQFAADYLRKGARVAVEGRLKQERWQDRSGQNRSSVVVSAFRLELLDTKADAQARQQRQAQQGGQGQGSSPQPVWAGGGNHFAAEEVPF